MWSPVDILIVFIPFILGFIPSVFCNIGRDAGKTVSFRPPPMTFAIVWPILFACVGISWVLARHDSKYSDIFYSLLSITLGLWTVIYGCLGNKIGGVYVLAASLVCIFAAASFGTQWSRVLLAPLFGWLILATLLNTFEVSNA